MRLSVCNSLMRLTASCEIKVRNVGRADGCVVVEIRQMKAAGGEITTLLLRPDSARELASVLLHHCGSPGTSPTGSARERLTIGQEGKSMLTGPEGVLNDILSSVDETGTYEVESSILLSGVFQSEDELEEWARGNGLAYEKSDLPGTTDSRKKIVTFSRRK